MTNQRDEEIRAHFAELEAITLELSAREPIFHRPEFGTTRADFDSMMHDNFYEVGASGQEYSRDYVLDRLSLRDHTPGKDVWETSNLWCQQISPDTYLLKYELLQDNTRHTRRTTLWCRTDLGWQILFHQGTIIQPQTPASKSLSPYEIERLAQGWLASTQASLNKDPDDPFHWVSLFCFDLIDDDPESFWEFILAVHRLEPSEQLTGMLAAGPVEDLLAQHGDQFIDRIEAEARRNPAFAFTLGGVWKSSMTDENWDRLQQVWDRRGWDGIPEA